MTTLFRETEQFPKAFGAEYGLGEALVEEPVRPARDLVVEVPRYGEDGLALLLS